MGSSRTRSVVGDRMGKLGDLDVDRIRKTVGDSAGGVGESVQDLVKNARKMAERQDVLSFTPMLIGVLLIAGLALFLGRGWLMSLIPGRQDVWSGRRPEGRGDYRI